MSIYYRNHEEYPELILIRDFTGKVGVEDIIESWEYIVSNDLIKDTTIGVINNLSGCELQMDMDGFKTLMVFLRKQEYLKRIKLAVLCDTPDIIVFPALAEKKEHELRIKPFSTMDAAESWLLET